MLNLLLKHKQVVKYLIAGGTSALVDLSLLYFFTDIIGIWYLISAGLAFAMAFFVSFFLQKFWTFRDGDKIAIYKQMGAYLAVALTNFVINIVMMYAMVDGLKIWYMLAQFITSGLIAIESYLVYNFFIFNGNNQAESGKMKILIATGIYPPEIGGPATMIKALAEVLKKSFYVKIITYADTNNSLAEIIRVKKSGKFLKYLIYFCKMLRLAERADILYVTETYSVGYFAYLIKKLIGKKYIIRLAGDSAWETASGAGWTRDYITDFQNIKYNRRIEKLKERRKKILINADAVIAVSNFMARVAKMIGVREEKITVIYNAVDFFPAPPKRVAPLNPTLIYAGRLVPWKGVAMLIRAVQELKNLWPNIIFEILGDGPEEAKLKELTGNLGLDKNVIFRGRVSEEESHKIFAYSTIFVLNTNYEGLPHSILNAMRSGLPVIATPIDGNREVIRDGENGLLAPYDKLGAWVGAINKLLNDQNLQKKFSSNGLETLKKFKWSEVVEKTLILIRGLGKQQSVVQTALNKMKILSLGLDNSVFNKSSALARRVIEYGSLVERYLVIVPSRKNEKIILSEKAEIYGSSGGNKLARLIKIYYLAEKLWRKEKYDIITVQDQYYLALIGWLLVKKFKIGLEIQVHGLEKYYGLRKLIANYVLPRANVVRCVSRRLKEELTSQFGVKAEKITVVPIFTEVKSKKLEIKSEFNGGKFIFLTVGRLVPVKNIGLQIEAMAEVAKKYSNAELWVIGDGPERKNFELRITSLRQSFGGQVNYELEKNIKLLGWKDNLGEYYSAADAFILTSNSEGWGLAVIEAASYGLPIIMTDVGCAGEVIEDGKSGLVISAGDKQKLVEAMLKIIEDRNLRNRLGENAKLAVGRLPNKEQTLALYKESWALALEKYKN